MGHNLNLLHSGGLDGAEYTDHTGVMGNGLLMDGKMCFNAAKSWQLGWYDDKALTLDVATTPSWNGRLVGVAEYQHENIMSSDNVLVKITGGGVVTASETYFIAFNRKTGINQDNVKGSDQVTIVKAEADGNGQSYLVATLAQSESYTIIGYTEDFRDLTIQVEAIDIAGLDVPGHAIVTIEVWEEPTSAPTMKPTSDPTKAPSTSPTKAPTESPTRKPTSAPTIKPTSDPTKAPSASPSISPTARPTSAPTSAPTMKPTSHPTKAPCYK